MAPGHPFFILYSIINLIPQLKIIGIGTTLVLFLLSVLKYKNKDYEKRDIDVVFLFAFFYGHGPVNQPCEIRHAAKMGNERFD
jgi:hypothetical protein